MIQFFSNVSYFHFNFEMFPYSKRNVRALKFFERILKNEKREKQMRSHYHIGLISCCNLLQMKRTHSTHSGDDDFLKFFTHKLKQQLSFFNELANSFSTNLTQVFVFHLTVAIYIFFVVKSWPLFFKNLSIYFWDVFKRCCHGDRNERLAVLLLNLNAHYGVKKWIFGN